MLFLKQKIYENDLKAGILRFFVIVYCYWFLKILFNTQIFILLKSIVKKSKIKSSELTAKWNIFFSDWRNALLGEKGNVTLKFEVETVVDTGYHTWLYEYNALPVTETSKILIYRDRK